MLVYSQGLYRDAITRNGAAAEIVFALAYRVSDACIYQ
jgi:hypothetical protein